MDPRHRLRTIEIGERSGHAQSPVEAAGGQLQSLSRLPQESNAVGVGSGDLFENPPRCLRIGARPVCSVLGEPLSLALSRSYHTSAHRSAPFSRRRENQIGGRNGWDFNLQVDAVQ